MRGSWAALCLLGCSFRGPGADPGDLDATPDVAGVCVGDGSSCDDGNAIDGDGCSIAGVVEAGFECCSQLSITLPNAGFEETEPTGDAILFDVAGWLIGRSGVGVISRAATAEVLCPEGDRCLDLDGGSPGEISVVFPTNPGSRYSVRFRSAGRCGANGACGATLRLAYASITDVSADSDAPRTPFRWITMQGVAGTANDNWDLQTLTFVAPNDQARLALHAATPTDSLVIDDIAIPPSVCRPATCGDGTLSTPLGEACDDGNGDDGDGCSALCRVEPGFTCDGSGCTAICGDGILTATEACDDDNTTNGDGCSDVCEVEAGSFCGPLLSDVAPSACGGHCGNGLLEAGESCDPGPQGTAGCLADCTFDTPTCGDGTVEPTEACDDGNTNDGDGCSGDCATVEANFDCQRSVAFRTTGLQPVSLVVTQPGGIDSAWSWSRQAGGARNPARKTAAQEAGRIDDDAEADAPNTTTTFFSVPFEVGLGSQRPRLGLLLDSDDNVQSARVDGQSVNLTQLPDLDGDRVRTLCPDELALAVGAHTIELEVDNGGGGPHYLRAVPFPGSVCCATP